MCVRTNRDASEHGGPQFLVPETVAEFRRSLDDGCASSPCSSAQHIASVRTSSAHLISQTFRAAGRPSLPRKMRQIQFLSEVRLVDVENPRDESLFFFRSFIARNLKMLLQRFPAAVFWRQPCPSASCPWNWFDSTLIVVWLCRFSTCFDESF